MTNGIILDKNFTFYIAEGINSYSRQSHLSTSEIIQTLIDNLNLVLETREAYDACYGEEKDYEALATLIANQKLIQECCPAFAIR